ncbi:MAG: hypothetical protein U0105_20670 [Candidatus Obscuribacterales bacterium]
MTAIEKQPVIGVDIGGVLIAHSDDRSDTSFFSKHYLKTPACDGAFEAIRQLVSAGCDVRLSVEVRRDGRRASLASGWRPTASMRSPD